MKCKGVNEYEGAAGLFKYTSFSDDGDRDVRWKMWKRRAEKIIILFGVVLKISKKWETNNSS